MTVQRTALATVMVASIVLALPACSASASEPGLFGRARPSPASPMSATPQITTKERLHRLPLTASQDELGASGFSRLPYVVDGDLWLLQARTGEVIRVDLATGSVAARIRIGLPSTRMADVTGLAEYDGRLWVTQNIHGSVAEIDPSTNRVLAEHRLDLNPYALAAGNHTLWAADLRHHEVVSLDPQSGIIRTRARVEAPIGLAVEPEGVWAAEHSGTTLARLNPSSGKVVDRVEVGSSPETAIYAYGYIWTALGADRGAVVRVDPTTLETTRIETDAPALSVMASADQLWAATGRRDCVPGGAVLRIDPVSLSVTGWLPTACPSWAYQDQSRVLAANGHTGQISSFLLGSRSLRGGPLR